MPYAALMVMVNLVAVAPLVLAAFAACRARACRTAEAGVIAGLATACTALAEVLVLSVFWRVAPLSTLVPVVHAGVGVVCVAWLLRRRFVGRAAARAWLVRCRRRWRACGAPARAAVSVAIGCAGAAVLYAAWNTGDEHDGALYRLVMVMQPVQDGYVGRVTHPWHGFADAYPRTVELMCSWAVLCTGDAAGQHMVGCAGLALLAAAGAEIARRVGLGRRAQVFTACLIVTTPLPLYLTCVLYNDTAVSGLLACGIAMAPDPPGRRWSRLDAAMMCLGLGLAASSKLHMVPLAAIVAGWRTIRTVRTPVDHRDVSPRALVAGLLLVGSLAAVQYVRSWLLYGSPAWPLGVRWLGMTVFDGPLAMEQLFITAKGPWAHRWATAVYKLFQTTSQDANGSFGLCFAIAVFPSCLALAVLVGVRRESRSPARSLLLTMFIAALCVPLSTNLRYSMYLLPVGYVLALGLIPAGGLRWPTGHPVRVWAVIAVLTGVNAFDWVRAVAKEVSEQTRAGVSLLSSDRNAAWYRRFMYVAPGMNPEMHREVHRLVPPGGRLIYTVSGLPGLLYDPEYRYAIEFRSIAAMHDRRSPPAVPACPPEWAGQWLESLRDDGASALLVYSGSQEDTMLAHAGSGFVLALDETPGGRWPPVRIYRRTHPEP